MRLSVEELQILLIRNSSLRARITLNMQAKPRIEPKPAKDRFDSDAERRYYYANIYPKEKEGKIRKLELHKSFEIVPATENNNRKYRAIRYSPDFYIEYQDGQTEVVEVKGRKIKKLRPDYPIRRQLFILNFCNPNRWAFTEVFDDEI